MRKIGIITLNGYYNYGNRLQNYALQEVLKELGFHVETIIIDSSKTSSSRKNIIRRIKDKNIKDIYTTVINKIENYYLHKSKLNQQRTQIFIDFSKIYISETEYSISEQSIPADLSERYDYFVAGSDQIWNPNYKTALPIKFLTFAPHEKRISYAPSFGVAEIPEEHQENYTKWLKKFAYLSVREEAGAKIIKELTGRDAPVVVDPTMLLSKEQWLSISNVASNKPAKEYLLTYFLGEISKERMKKITKIARENDLDIVNLAQIKDKVPYLSGPSEFIDYINSASVFCTDSFHGAVFSILLDTPFIIFNREGKLPSMNSRIETLLKKFKLESRFAENIQLNNQIFDLDYSHTVPILEVERKKSIDFLKKALDIKK